VEDEFESVESAEEETFEVTPVAPEDVHKKCDRIIHLIAVSEDGVTVDQIVDVTGWKKNTVRGFLSGVLKKKMGLNLVAERKAGEKACRYKFAAQ